MKFEGVCFSLIETVLMWREKDLVMAVYSILLYSEHVPNFHRHDRHPPGHRKFWQLSTFMSLVHDNFVNWVSDRECSTRSTAWVVITVLS
jgi:hypothetical protein